MYAMASNQTGWHELCEDTQKQPRTLPSTQIARNTWFWVVGKAGLDSRKTVMEVLASPVWIIACRPDPQRMGGLSNAETNGMIDLARSYILLCSASCYW